jgi:hypothetical protein
VKFAGTTFKSLHRARFDPVLGDPVVRFLRIELAYFDWHADKRFELVFRVVAEILAVPVADRWLVPEVFDVIRTARSSG